MGLNGNRSNMKGSDFCHNFKLLLVSGLRRFALVAALICLAISATSCRTVRDVQTVHDSIVVHDTTTITLVDTVRVTDVKYDSIDRYVEKMVYVDTNGVWHEKEVEHLTHYTTTQKEEYQKTIDSQRSYISLLEEKLKAKETVKEVEKPLNWFQKTWIVFGWCFICGIAVFLVYLYFKLKRKGA